MMPLPVIERDRVGMSPNCAQAGKTDPCLSIRRRSGSGNHRVPNQRKLRPRRCWNRFRSIMKPIAAGGFEVPQGWSAEIPRPPVAVATRADDRARFSDFGPTLQLPGPAAHAGEGAGVKAPMTQQIGRRIGKWCPSAGAGAARGNITRASAMRMMWSFMVFLGWQAGGPIGNRHGGNDRSADFQSMSVAGMGDEICGQAFEVGGGDDDPGGGAGWDPCDVAMVASVALLVPRIST